MSDDLPPVPNPQSLIPENKWLVMLAVGTGLFLSTIDGTIVNIALPTLESNFDTQFAIVQWVVLAYLLIVSVLMLGVGRLADMIGKKPIFTAGFVIFTAGSVLCGLAPSIYWLIGFRALQAIGASFIIALGFGIITEAFPAAERGKALGIAGTITSIGIVVGPSLGGLLIEGLSWRWIFFVNLPVGIAGTLLALRYIPNIKPAGGQRFDFLGAATLFIGLLSLLLGLTFGQQTSFDDRRVLILLASFVVFLALFIWIERRAKQPMIDLRLFREVDFSVGLVTSFITFMTIAATVILMPFYLENILGYSPREVGFLMAIVPIVLAIAAPVSGTLSDRFGTRPITVIGLAILVLGYYALSTLDAETTAAGFLWLFLPIGIGMGVFQSPNNSAIMGTAQPQRLGVVSGMLAVTRTTGQTTGIAILGALWAGRVLFYAGETLVGGATNASTAAQVSALQDTFLVMVAMTALALLLALYSFLRDRRKSS